MTKRHLRLWIKLIQILIIAANMSASCKTLSASIRLSIKSSTIDGMNEKNKETVRETANELKMRSKMQNKRNAPISQNGKEKTVDISASA